MFYIKIIFQILSYIMDKKSIKKNVLYLTVSAAVIVLLCYIIT